MSFVSKQLADKQFILSVIRYVLLTASFNANAVNQGWLNLLHYEGGVSQVQSARFFLSETRLPDDELRIFEKKLTESNGFDLACEFPARYSFLKFKKFIPHYDLEKCEGLKKFVSSFQSKRISIALTTEFPKSPASAFGHVMVVFHDDAHPGLDSDAVHFSAAVGHSSSFFRYALDGLFGNFDGFYFRDPLFKKVSEYTRENQRYIFYFELNTTEEQRLRLIYHLFELRSAKFRYYFVKHNCGFHIESLLNIAFQENVFSNMPFTLPVDVVTRRKGKISNTTIEEPLIALAKKSIEGLSFEERRRFNESLTLDRYESRSSDSDGVKQSLFYYQLYRFRGERKPSQHLDSYLNSSFSRKVEMKVAPLSPLERPEPRQLMVFYKGRFNQQTLVFAKFRPLLIDKTDLQLGATGESEQTIMDGQISFGYGGVQVEELNFINYRIMPEFSYYFRDLSWQLYSGMNKENLSYKLAWSTFFGAGQTFRIFKKTIFNYLVSVGSDVDPQEVRAALLPEVRLYQYLNEKTKIVYEYKNKLYFKNNFWLHEINIYRQVDVVGLRLGYRRDVVEKNGFIIGASFNF